MGNVFDPEEQQRDPSSTAAAAIERLARVVRAILWEQAAVRASVPSRSRSSSTS